MLMPTLTRRVVAPGIRALVTFCLVAAIGIALVTQIATPSPSQLFAMTGAGGGTTIGTVTSIATADHNTCVYRYSINAHRYTAQQSCAASEPRETLVVHYLRSDPAIQTSSDPTTQAIELLALPVVIGLFATAAVVVVIPLTLDSLSRKRSPRRVEPPANDRSA